MPASAAPAITGTITDPQFRVDRASLAGRASHSLDAHIRAIIKRAGQLTDEQIAELRGLLPPAVRSAEAA